MIFHKSVTSCVFLRHRTLPVRGVGNSASFILMFNMIYAKYIDVKRGTPHDRRGEGEIVALSMAVLHTDIFA